jgi:hypothetical protein
MNSRLNHCHWRRRRRRMTRVLFDLKEVFIEEFVEN